MELRDYLFGGDTRKTAYKALDAGSLRSRAINQNLANVSTPEYRRKEVSFEEELKKVLKLKLKGTRTDGSHMYMGKSAMLGRIKPEVYEPTDRTLPGEINNVDIDLEAAKLAENQILYNYYLKFAGFGKYQAAISGNPAP